jgi:hypothetical protein
MSGTRGLASAKRSEDGSGVSTGTGPNAQSRVLNGVCTSTFFRRRPANACLPVVGEQAQILVMKAQWLFVVAPLMFGCQHSEPGADYERLFSQEGIPQGWVVRAWNEVRDPAEGNPVWRVEDGVLTGGEPRGSWLLSEQEYEDFILEFEFKLGERGNSGCALRAPMGGDPAFDGIELQMADFRYNPEAKESELTGGLYRAVAPVKQVYRPTEWNHYRIECRGASLRVMLNRETILDVNLDEETATVQRHDGTDAPPLKDRPRRGRIGFQELSRDGSHVEIRNARVQRLD